MSAVSGSEREQVVVAPGAGVSTAPGVRPPLAVPRRLLRLRSDTALAERFAAGDEAAFDVIYERHRPVVLAVCMGVLGAPADAEDATQETFSALAVALRTRPPAELRPWLIRVARNASIDTTRRRRHRLLTIDGEIPEVAARPASSGKAELAVVLDGIRELPEGQRMALLMRELGGHSYAEIADFLDTDEESVKGLIARARVGLRSYREATELSCSAARVTIAAEPDGRRYDKTIRRHLRTCGSCRSYREALRDDAKALRAALPIQAGAVATGSLSGGMLTAAKGSLLGYGLTQAATTCAASACAVGAIGGMVFVAPVHKLGLPALGLPAAKSAPAHKPTHTHHAITKAVPATQAAPTTHLAVTVHTSTPAISERGAETPAKAGDKKTARVVHHRHHAATVTKVKLDKLTPVHHASPPASTAVAPITATSNPVPVTTPPSTVSGAGTSSSAGPTSSAGSTGSTASGGSSAATPSVGYPTAGSGHSGTGSQPTGFQSGSQPAGTQPTGGQSAQTGNGSDSVPANGDHHGGPVHVIIGGAAADGGKPTYAGQPTFAGQPTTTVASAPTPPAVGAWSGETTTTTTSTVTTSPSYTPPATWGSHAPVVTHGQSGARHAVGWRDTATTQTITSSSSWVPGTQTTVTTSSTPATYGAYGASNPYGRGQRTGSATSQSLHTPSWGLGGR